MNIFRSPNCFTYMNHPVDNIVDELLTNCIKSGIIQCESGEYDLILTFQNGIKANLWNANKPYAWLQKGDFFRNGELFLTYKESRPKKSTMKKLEKEIINYLLSNELHKDTNTKSN